MSWKMKPNSLVHLRVPAATKGRSPIKRLGSVQSRVLHFALKYPGWHTCGRDRSARRAMASLARRRVLAVQGDQFKFCGTCPE